MNTLGLVAAITVFCSVWAGHVAVRKIEALAPVVWQPAAVFAALGLTVEYFALRADGRHMQVVFGIIGVTLLWDAFEMFRQQKRILKGHAPANPANPRHAAFLSAPDTHATTLDLLDREPSGSQSHTGRK